MKHKEDNLPDAPEPTAKARRLRPLARVIPFIAKPRGDEDLLGQPRQQPVRKSILGPTRDPRTGALGQDQSKDHSKNQSDDQSKKRGSVYKKNSLNSPGKLKNQKSGHGHGHSGEHQPVNLEQRRDHWIDSLPRQSWRLVVVMVAVSILVHLLSLVNLSRLNDRHSSLDHNAHKPIPIKIRSVQMEKPKEKKLDEIDPLKQNRILETKLKPTKEVPKEKVFAGQQDHVAKKQMKTKLEMQQQRALDAGEQGASVAKPQANTHQDLKTDAEAAKKQQSEIKADKSTQFKGPGTMIVGAEERKPRNVYESILPLGNQDLAGQVTAGYKEHIDDDVEIGDRIDLNTSNYRYIGYFTGLRKAIELVWIYPAEAIYKQFQGEVTVEFYIHKTGKVSRVKVIKSSGYSVLDRGVVEALKLASPFAPLPDSLKKEGMIVTGSFVYRLMGS